MHGPGHKGWSWDAWVDTQVMVFNLYNNSVWASLIFRDSKNGLEGRFSKFVTALWLTVIQATLQHMWSGEGQSPATGTVGGHHQEDIYQVWFFEDVVKCPPPLLGTSSNTRGYDTRVSIRFLIKWETKNLTLSLGKALLGGCNFEHKSKSVLRTVPRHPPPTVHMESLTAEPWRVPSEASTWNGLAFDRHCPSLSFEGRRLQDVIAGHTDGPISEPDRHSDWKALGTQLSDVSLTCSQVFKLPGAAASPENGISPGGCEYQLVSTV